MGGGPFTIVCACSFSGLVGAGAAKAAAARAAGGELLLVDDMCRIAVEEPQKLRDFCSGRAVRVFACRPRAAKAVLEFAGAGGDFEFFDMRPPAPGAFDGAGEDAPGGEIRLPPPRGTWVAWYPVIDASRCVSCGKCADFCVFGVYSFSGGRIPVENPRACKDKCPACARVCPKSAVIFPKCAEEDFICGGEGFAPEASGGGGGFYEALRRRRAAAGGILRDGGR